MMISWPIKSADRTTRRHPLIMLALASLLLRALVPLGYMPGNALAGEFVVLCPVGISADIVRLIHAEHGAHHEQLIDMDAGCPIGTALQAAALPTLPAIESSIISRPWYQLPGSDTESSRKESRYYAIRAPPSV